MLEDFIFKYRNKEYGAYQIRRKYRKTLWFSLVIGVLVIFLLFYIPFLMHLKKQYMQPIEPPPVVVDAELTEIHIEPPKEENLASQQHEEEIPKVEKQPELMVNQDTVSKEDLEPDTSHFQEMLAKEPENPRLKEVGVFSCTDGLEEFRTWFLQNFALPESIDHKNDIKFSIEFNVNKLGFVDHIVIKENIAPQISESIEKILLNSPRWKPCFYEGNTVKQIYTLPVFILSSKTLNEGGKYFKNLK